MFPSSTDQISKIQAVNISLAYKENMLTEDALGSSLRYGAGGSTLHISALSTPKYYRCGTLDIFSPEIYRCVSQTCVSVPDILK